MARRSKKETSKSNSQLADERTDDQEVAVRQADSDSNDKFVKDYVIFNHGDGENDHEDYVNATRQEAINRGLRPTGDVSFDGKQAHPDGESQILTFSVGVEPADKVGLPFEVKHAHADEEDQHGMEAGEDPDKDQT